jgi:hypothetical protein
LAEANWYWAQGEERNGPVTSGAIARLVADGKLGAADLIWKEGMADWIPVSRVPALTKYLQKSPAAPLASAAQVAPAPMEVETEAEPVGQMPSAVGYYNPSGSMPPRAAETLRRHARPRGDIGDWPLDDPRVMQFDQALRYRKKIDGAASLYRLLFLLISIVDVVGLIAGVAAMTSARGPAQATAIAAIAGIGAIYIGLTVLYYFAWKGTTRSQTWAPLTMGILFSIGVAFYVVMMVFVGMSSGPHDTTAVYIGAAFGIVIVGAFAYVSFSGYAAIGPYLQQPAWCQELLSKTSG